MALNLGSQNLIGGPPGVGINLGPLRLGFGERKPTPGTALSFEGSSHGFSVFRSLADGRLLFVKRAKRVRRRPPARRGSQTDKLMQLAVISSLLRR